MAYLAVTIVALGFRAFPQLEGVRMQNRFCMGRFRAVNTVLAFGVTTRALYAGLE